MINVLKSTGEKQEFSEIKLRESIQRAGVPDELQDNCINHIKLKLYDGIPTSEIYRHVGEFLGSSSHPYSRAKYSLKQGIMDLGPTGYPFEDYISEILKLEGYQTQVRQTLQGKCISHEIDVIAKKDTVNAMIECKFHNVSTIHSQVHVSLYTKARFDDVMVKNNFTEAWLVTNTRITQDALDYALCSNMKVLSWDYPEKGSLRDLIDKHQLHPITVLSNMSQSQKQILAQNHVVLAKDVCVNPSSLDILGLPKDKKAAILSECEFVYK